MCRYTVLLFSSFYLLIGFPTATVINFPPLFLDADSAFSSRKHLSLCLSLHSEPHFCILIEPEINIDVKCMCVYLHLVYIHTHIPLFCPLRARTSNETSTGMRILHAQILVSKYHHPVQRTRFQYKEPVSSKRNSMSGTGKMQNEPKAFVVPGSKKVAPRGPNMH